MTLAHPRARTRRTTPDAAGYLLAVVVSILLTALLIVAVSVRPTSAGQAAAGLLLCCVYVSVFAAVPAPVGVLLVHLCCRRVEAQWVHVLAAGLAGVLTGMTFGALAAALSGVFGTLTITCILGVAAAAGRAAVIPLARPVDDDFRLDLPAC